MPIRWAGTSSGSLWDIRVEIEIKIRVEITAGLACTFLNFVFRFDLIVCFRPKGFTAIPISI